MDLNPYLSFNGSCAEAFAFYAGVLGGTVEFAMTWGESPMADQMPPDWQGKVMHTSLAIEGRRILGADAPPSYFSKPQGFSVALMFDEVDRAASVFAALSEGGEVRMPFGPTFWTKGFGMLIDRYGIPWMVNGPAEAMPS